MRIHAYPKLTEYHKQIPENVKAYLSGNFDGEGCIRMALKDSGKLKQRLIIIVSLANKQTLELYAKCFNGAIRLRKNFTNKPLYSWTLVKNDDLYNFIEAIIPFSIEKKPQLELAKEWLLKRAEERKTVALSDDFIQYSNDIAEQLKQLKKL